MPWQTSTRQIMSMQTDRHIYQTYGYHRIPQMTLLRTSAVMPSTEPCRATVLSRLPPKAAGQLYPQAVL